jgi:SulP family sulfate permease
MGWTPADLPLVGQLPRAFPSFAPPRASMDEVQGLLGGALALALLGMLESVAIAKSIASHTGERISANQEFFAQGFKNAVSSFFQCIPGSGSFTRSALDHAAGAETRFAAVYNAIFVALIFWLAGGLAKFIPLASLGAVLIVIGWGLIDWRYVPRMRRASRADAIVCGMTFVAAMALPLEYAIFVGVFLNLALYLRTASRLHVTEMFQPSGGPFLERPIRDKHTGERQVVFLQLEGDLFFGVADELQDRLTALAASGVRVVILRLKRTHSIDATVLGVLERFAAGMGERQGYVILCGVKPELMCVLRDYGLVDQLGRENVFETGVGIFTSAKQALARARELVGRSIDTLGIPTDDEPDAPNYVI